MTFDVKSLVAVAVATAGVATYAEQTYMKQAQAEQQYRALRLDRLYRDKDDCDRLLRDLYRGNESKESELCKRVRREIKALEKDEKK